VGTPLSEIARDLDRELPGLNRALEGWDRALLEGWDREPGACSGGGIRKGEVPLVPV
jgi:hypothetical protein